MERGYYKVPLDLQRPLQNIAVKEDSHVSTIINRVLRLYVKTYGYYDRQLIKLLVETSHKSRAVVMEALESCNKDIEALAIKLYSPAKAIQLSHPLKSLPFAGALNALKAFLEEHKNEF